jgi:ubiquinone/menaquinone biosynthesis C-methylase UbiE
MGKKEEIEFHDKFVTNEDVRSFESYFYSDIAKEKENKLAIDFFGQINGKNLLIYGSGLHTSLIKVFLELGATVTAIDISPQTISKINKTIENDGYINRFTALVMDCEKLDFEDQSYDIVFSRSILHHLNINIALAEINRVLKPHGKFTALEPLGTNPLINLYRFFTPQSRTHDEHPFLEGDVKQISNYFKKSKVYYLYFFTLLSYGYRLLDRNENRFRKLFSFLSAVDSRILRAFPLCRYLCWDVFFCCEKDDSSE